MLQLIIIYPLAEIRPVTVVPKQKVKSTIIDTLMNSTVFFSIAYVYVDSIYRHYTYSEATSAQLSPFKSCQYPVALFINNRGIAVGTVVFGSVCIWGAA